MEDWLKDALNEDGEKRHRSRRKKKTSRDSVVLDPENADLETSVMVIEVLEPVAKQPAEEPKEPPQSTSRPEPVELTPVLSPELSTEPPSRKTKKTKKARCKTCRRRGHTQFECPSTPHPDREDLGTSLAEESITV